MQWHVQSSAALSLRTFVIFGTGTSLQSALQSKESLELGWDTPQAAALLTIKAKADWLSAWDWRGKEFTIPCKRGLCPFDIPNSFISSWQLCFQDTLLSQRSSVFATLSTCISAVDTLILTSITHSLVYLSYSLSSSCDCGFRTPNMFSFLLFSSAWTTFKMFHTVWSGTPCAAAETKTSSGVSQNTATHSASYQKNLWNPNATKLSVTDTVFRTFSPEGMLVIFMERTGSIWFKIIPKFVLLPFSFTLSYLSEEVDTFPITYCH